MSIDDQTIAAIREAVRLSPGSIPLRQHLAELLMLKSAYIEAEKEYRQALMIDPDNKQIKIGLAEAFYSQEKNSAALVLVEELTGGEDPHPAALMLLSRIYLRSGDEVQAARAYKQAVTAEPALFDSELEVQLQNFLDGEHDDDDDDDDDDFRLKLPLEELPSGLDSDVERPDISFDDVGGMDSVKEEIRMKIIHPLEHPEIFQAYGKKIGGGILMYGPPGCGKTYLARATAGEVNANFLSVGLHDVLNMYIGQSESNLHELFEMARENQPCVLFFDEVDALGASRSDMRHSSSRQLINQFLAEMDGVNASNEGVLILAATNAPWHLDSAFRRPGRFDRIIFVPPPDRHARRAILEILLQDKPVEKIEYDKIARKTEGFSGADLKAIVDLAVEAKLSEAMRAGHPGAITTGDLLTSLKRLTPTTKEWFATARNYALYANQSGIYDEILAFLKLTR
ncbi:MAG: AAA family ATPase [Calditrichae bacterium]|nr:AAA family ATPase [Calditrichota bacterium]MCB0314067.1 AAA family ATPase [Calditrichota bacterium]MCB9088544.1 AAA family ATPase [Calditrichia bacterium]